MSRLGRIFITVLVPAFMMTALLGVARAQAPINVVTTRYPATEFYASAMKSALPNVPVEVSLMPQDKTIELSVLALSQNSNAYDVVWGNAETIQRYAKNNWLEPLDDLWAKYKAQFKLDDIPESLLSAYRYQGKLYGLPFNTNVMMFFYRADIFKEKGLSPPKTFDEYLQLAERLNSGGMSGTVACLKPVDAALNEMHWYMNAFDQPWFDNRLKPVFNGSNGVRAVNTLKAITKFAPPGFTGAANDECTVYLQQNLAAMGLQWATRAGAMDDPQRSRVVGKIDWTSPPGGGQRVVIEGFAISRFSSKDKDLVFRVLATATNEENMRKAGGMILPPRTSILSDPALQGKYRHWPAARQSLGVARPYPAVPEFLEAGESITRLINQAVTGAKTPQDALDTAAKETEELLARRGYYR